MLQIWNDLLNISQKKLKILMELENIAIGMDRQVTMEYNLGRCQ